MWELYLQHILQILFVVVVNNNLELNPSYI